jgi:predicted ABC-type ATPase
MTESKKTLYIISGCNGAGKTTASLRVLPGVLDCKQFVNADEIARGLSPLDPDSMAIEAGKLMKARAEQLLEGEENFAMETTLSARTYIKLIKRAREKGFQVQLIFFWLKSPETAITRVAQRVQEGGHNVPQNVIIRRYYTGLNNLFNLFMPIVDVWMLFDNSDMQKVMIATGGMDIETKIYNEELFNEIKNNVC